jgi:hypothetical protein
LRRQEKIGYGAVVVAVFLGLLGTVGYSLEGVVSDVPTPNVPNRSFFADEPLPEQTLAVFLSATMTLNWDRDDVFVVIVDEDEKNTCDVQLYSPASMVCTMYDEDVIVSSTNGEEGLVWEVEEGVYYAGIGTSDQGGLPQGTAVDLTYSVHLQAGFASYFVFALIGVSGLAYSRVE